VVGTAREPGTSDLVCDLLDTESIARAIEDAAPDLVVNLAGISSVGLAARSPARTFEVNAIGVQNLLEALQRRGQAVQVICISSGYVYGVVPEDELPVSEDRPPFPIDTYATSKASMELICGQYARSQELRIAVVRAFNTVGPGQPDSFAVSSFARQVAEAEHRGLDGLALRAGNLSAVRDFTDARDVVRAFLSIGAQGLVGTFNVCSGRPVELESIITDCLQMATPLDLRVEVDRSRLRRADIPANYGSAERLRQATGWEPEIPLERSVEDTLGWWRDRVSAE
jgi:GDP-4-dehydro-6-deoxy-D-mannose reductase